MQLLCRHHGKPVTAAGLNYQMRPCALSGEPCPAVGLSCNSSPSLCTSAGLVSSLGASSIPSIIQAALQASHQQVSIPPALLHQAHSIDQQALQLLTQRGQGILAGLAGLQAYSAALRLVLGSDYADSSHHSQWASAIESAIAASDTEVSYLTSSAVCLHTFCGCIGACITQAVSWLLCAIECLCSHRDSEMTMLCLSQAGEVVKQLEVCVHTLSICLTLDLLACPHTPAVFSGLCLNPKKYSSMAAGCGGVNALDAAPQQPPRYSDLLACPQSPALLSGLCQSAPGPAAHACTHTQTAVDACISRCQGGAGGQPWSTGR